MVSSNLFSVTDCPILELTYAWLQIAWVIDCVGVGPNLIFIMALAASHSMSNKSFKSDSKSPKMNFHFFKTSYDHHMNHMIKPYDMTMLGLVWADVSFPRTYSWWYHCDDIFQANRHIWYFLFCHNSVLLWLNYLLRLGNVRNCNFSISKTNLSETSTDLNGHRIRSEIFETVPKLNLSRLNDMKSIKVALRIPIYASDGHVSYMM